MHGAGDALEQLDLAAGIELLAVALDQLRLVVEGIDLAGGAGHEELHDALGLGAVVQPAIPVRLAPQGRLVRGEETILAEQVGQGDASEPAAGMPEEVSAIHVRLLREFP